MNDTRSGDLPAASRGRVALLVLTPVVVAWAALMVSSIPFATAEATLALGLVVVPVVIAVFTLGDGSAERWSRQRGAEFEPEVLAVLSRHLVRTRVARTLGVTLGIAAWGMLLARYNAAPESFAWYTDGWGNENPMWLSGFGYVAASIGAELAKPAVVTSGAGATAVLARRGLGEYLDPFIRRSLVRSGGAAAVVMVAALLSAAVADRLLAVSGPRLHVALAGVVGLSALAAAFVLARRRERAPDNVALAYEELTRTAAVNALSGAAAAMFVLHGVGAAVLLSRPTESIVPAVLGLVGTIVALSLWITSGTSLVFRTRRLDRIRGVA